MRDMTRFQRMCVTGLLAGVGAASASAGMVYEFQFQDGAGAPTLANTGTAGGVATAQAYLAYPTGSAVAGTPGPASNTYAYNFPLSVNLATESRGPALVLPGSITALELTSAASELTVATWVKWNGADANTADPYQGIVNKLGTGNKYGWGLGLNASGQLAFLYGGISGGVPAAVTRAGGTATALPVGTWTHVAITMSPGDGVAGGDDGFVRFYLNGVLKSTAALDFLPSPTSADPTNDGSVGGNPIWAGLLTNNGGYRSPLNGTLDNLQMYDTALTDSQVLALTTIPEPTALAPLAIGGLLMLKRRRRR